MKWKSMHTGKFRRSWRTKALSLLALATMSGLVIGATTFKESGEKHEATRAEALEHLQKIGHDCFLLRSLPAGQGENVRLILSQDVINEIGATQLAYATDDPASRRFSHDICACVLRDMHKNPDRYLCSSPDLRKAQRAAWKALETSFATQVTTAGQDS